MSTDTEKFNSIAHAVEFAKRRLQELDSRKELTRAESFERDMTIECIRRGNLLIHLAQPDKG